MTLKTVNELPKPKRKETRADLLAVIELFVQSDAQLVKVEDEDGEYASTIGMYSVLRTAVSMYPYPVKAIMRNGEVYLQKTL